MKNTSRHFLDGQAQIIIFLVEKDSQKLLRKLPVSFRNVSKLPPGAPRGPPRSPSERLKPFLGCSNVLGDRFRDARGPTRTTENLWFLKEFNDFHYCGNPAFPLVSASHPRRPRGPPGLREALFSAPAPFPLVYFTRLFLECTVLLQRSF